MSKPIVVIADQMLSVTPGQRVSTKLTFRNSSPLVGQYRISMPPYCEAAKWATFRQVSPSPSPEARYAEISFLRSQQEAEVEVVFNPPASRSTPGGISHYVIAVDAQEAVNESTTAEGALQISGQPAIDSRLFNDKVKGRTSGRFRLGVANTGNTPVRVKLSSDYDAGATAVAWAPDELALGPRDQNEFLVELRARKVKPTGKGETHSANLTPRASTPAGEMPAVQTHSVTFEQRPWIPTILLPVLALAAAAGLYFALPREPEVGGGPGAPNPPTDLTATADLQQVNLRWVSDERALATEVGLIDCGAKDEVTADPLAKQIFDGVSAGVLDISTAGDGQLCFRARSRGPEDKWSRWGNGIGPIQRASDSVPPPTNVRIDGGLLVFDMAPGVEQVDLIVDNESLGRDFTGSPIDLAGMELGDGSHAVAIRSVQGDSYSSSVSPGEDFTDVGDGPPTDSAWVLFMQSGLDITDATVHSIQGLVRSKAGAAYASRAQYISKFELPAARNSGEPYIFQLSANGPKEEIGERVVVADWSGQLNEAQATEYCRTFLEGVGPGEPTTCVAYSADGAQLAIPPAAGSGS